MLENGDRSFHFVTCRFSVIESKWSLSFVFVGVWGLWATDRYLETMGSDWSYTLEFHLTLI